MLRVGPQLRLWFLTQFWKMIPFYGKAAAFLDTCPEKTGNFDNSTQRNSLPPYGIIGNQASYAAGRISNIGGKEEPGKPRGKTSRQMIQPIENGAHEVIWEVEYVYHRHHDGDFQLAVGMAASDPDIRSRCVPVRPL